MAFLKDCPQNFYIKNLTEGWLLGFDYDFGITIATCNAVAMVLVSVLMSGIHPLKMFKMSDVQGGECLS
jgi:hypothetical protein